MSDTIYSEDNMHELREYYLGELDKQDAEIERLRAELAIGNLQTWMENWA